MPILGCKTKDEAKDEAKLNRDIDLDPTLNKLNGVLSMISSHQQAFPKSDFMDCNLTVPVSVKDMLANSSLWKYNITFINATPPQGWNGYVTTWVIITKISWA